MAKIIESDNRIGLGTSMGNDVPSGSLETGLGDFGCEYAESIAVPFLSSSSGPENSALFEMESNEVLVTQVCRWVDFGWTVNGCPDSIICWHIKAKKTTALMAIKNRTEGTLLMKRMYRHCRDTGALVGGR